MLDGMYALNLNLPTHTTHLQPWTHRLSTSDIELKRFSTDSQQEDL